MFGFFRKKQQVPAVVAEWNKLGTDMHSHLLPGIDDGAPDVEESIELIRGMLALGFKKFITTPHIYTDIYPNNAQTIREAHTLLQQRLVQEGMEVTVHAAAEYYMDEHFDAWLQKGEPLLTLHRNWVLVEFSFVAPPMDLDNKIFNLQMAGYQPVLAHPERYGYLHRKKAQYHRFKDQGCLLQVNVLSLAGYYGSSVKDAAQWMVSEGLVDLLGTDLHHERHLRAMNDPHCYIAVQALIESGRLMNHAL